MILIAMFGLPFFGDKEHHVPKTTDFFAKNLVFLGD